MRKIIFYMFVFLVVNQTFAQERKNFEFNGYIQVRGTSNLFDNTGFSVRRLKLWIKSAPEFSKHWSYKIQTTFSSFNEEKFFLQDVKINYKTGLFSFDIGQFVPQYSLERFQHDYKIGIIERAKVINCLIPNGTLGVRDIGLQANIESKNKLFETHLGIFNGYGIKEYRFDNKGFMITHKTSFQIPIKQNIVKFGYSLEYRYAENIQLKSILPDTVLFSGHDFRYNLFAMFKTKLLKLQAEFLQADLDKDNAYGYYFLSEFNFKKSQIVFSYEKYKDLIEETSDNPYCRIGYNYFIKDYHIKVSLDNFFELSSGKIKNYYANLQLQLFLGL